jgi:uncharacterized membrane protein
MRYKELDRALAAWVAEGLVFEQQAEAIRRRERQASHRGRRDAAIQTLAWVGALVAGLGVILFFAANWDAIPRPTRVVALLAAIAAAYGGGYVLRELRGRPAVGEALLLLGAIAFGASLFLVGQMYHVQAHDPLALLLWSALVVPTAAVVRSRWLASLGLVTFVAWIVWEAVEAADDEAIGSALVVVALLGAALYGLGTGLAARIGPAFSGPMRALGAVLLPAGVFVFTFQVFYDVLNDREALSGREELGLAVLALGVVAGAAALALDRTRATGRWEGLVLLAAGAVVLVSVLFPPADDAILLALAANVVMAALALGAVLVGYANEEGWLVNLGIALVGIDVFARYFDFFWDLMPRSLVFLGAGFVLLALAWALERQRSRLLARMERT